MQEPTSVSGPVPPGPAAGERGARGRPSTRSVPPKFACTSTPTVRRRSPTVGTREAVPTPALNPSATVPVPAPTHPSATGPPEAVSRAARTCSSWTGRARMSDRKPSLHSPTTGLRLRTSSHPGRSSTQPTRASATRNADSVEVSSTGVSSAPSSVSWVVPISLP